MSLSYSKSGPLPGKLLLHSAWELISPSHVSLFSDHYSLVGLMDTSKFGFQSQLFLGPISELKFLKVGVHDFRVLLFAPQGEAVFLISFYLCFTVPRVGLKEKLCPSLFYQFAVGLLSFSHTQPVLRVFRECFSMIQRVHRRRILLWHHLGVESSFLF